MAENGSLNNNNKNDFDNFNINSTQTSREFINSSTTITNTDTTTRINFTSLSGTTSLTSINEQREGQSERDATHFRLRDGVLEGISYIKCLSCGESFKSTSLIEVYDHYKERPHLTYYSNCLYCQGKVHQYYHTRYQQIKYYHDCLRWKRGEDN